MKIGVLLPLTGESASYGIDCQNGARLALEGQTDVAVVYDDSREDIGTTLTAFRKMVSYDHVNVLLGGLFSNTSLPLAPSADEWGIVMLTPAGSDEAISRAGSRIFSLYPTATQEGQFVAEAIRKEAGIKSIAVVYQSIKSAHDLSKALMDDLQAHALTAIKQAVIPDLAVNYPYLISKLGNPDAIFICADKDQVIRYISKSKELGVTSRWYSQSTLYEPAAIAEYGAILEGVVFSTPNLVRQSPDPKIAGFWKNYSERFGKEATVWSAFGYDGANLLLEACRKASTPDELADVLQENKDFFGVTDRTRFSKDQRQADKKLVLMEIHEGRPRVFREKEEKGEGRE